MKTQIMRRQKGQHLQWSDRLIIERMRLNRATTREIAAAIGCSHVTIVKELKRGQYEHTNSDLTTEIRYSPELAERQHRVNMTIKGPEVKIGHDHALARTLEHLIVKEKYSPYAAVARLNLEGWAYNVRVCARTVYNYIYKGVLGITQKQLPMQGRMKPRTRSGSDARQKRVSAGTPIDFRPEEVNIRNTLGHWEMDTVYSSKKAITSAALLVLTERLSRLELIILLRNRTSGCVVRALNALERSMGRKAFLRMFKTITVDNGSEFADFEGMERSALQKTSKRTEVFYCHAHHSWERGSNENANKLIRRHFPKGTDFSKVTAAQVSKVQEWINQLPRAIFGGMTSNMVYQLHLAQDHPN